MALAHRQTAHQPFSSNQVASHTSTISGRPRLPPQRQRASALTVQATPSGQPVNKTVSGKGPVNKTVAGKTAVTSGAPAAAPAAAKRRPRRRHVATEDYDMDFWHYQPMWMQPPVILILGVLLVAGANIVAEPSIKTTVLAAGPVGLLLGIFLFVLPRQFKSFATQYMDSHDMDDDLNSPSKSISPPRRK